MNEKKLYEIVSRVLDVPLTELDLNSSPKTIQSWDSFTGYILLDEIEVEFNVKVTLDEALEISNLGDYKILLEKKGIKMVDNE